MMNMNSFPLRHKTPGRALLRALTPWKSPVPASHRARRGFSMVELIIASAIALMFVVLSISTLVLSGRTMANISREVRIRETYAPVYRMIENAIRASDTVRIYDNYDQFNRVTDGSPGTCVIFSVPNPGGIPTDAANEWQRRFVPQLRTMAVPELGAASGVPSVRYQHFAFYQDRSFVRYHPFPAAGAVFTPASTDLDPATDIAVCQWIEYSAERDADSSGAWDQSETGPWGFELTPNPANPSEIWINMTGDSRVSTAFENDLEINRVRIVGSAMTRR